MKTAKALVFVFVLGFGSFSLAQNSISTGPDFQFYGKLAQRDAAYEQGLHFSNEQDELDYWRDQKNFEKLLLQTNPKAYHIYITTKRPTYLNHIQDCHKECAHGNFYKRELASYLLKTANDSLNVQLLSEVNTKKEIGKFK